ncbi:hypothetical protein [Microvirga yunnanensis]|uniref:hypothetical protein n=1 Tax=Microvirga yunnanensis TaxID=2953740 RepID=UPI0021CA5343|nr:hypothetical protein [Microvirga sp. HBU65207]
MPDHQDSCIGVPDPTAQLRYAIRSARAVVEALILRDRTAAEAAALRTCRDCDLLIHLIRDLTHLLLEAQNSPLGFDPVATAALVRRANHVLFLVEASPPQDGVFASSDDNHDDDSARIHQAQGSATAHQMHRTERISEPDAARRQTVASLGVRVRLIPYDVDDGTTPPMGGSADNSSARASSLEPPGTDEG